MANFHNLDLEYIKNDIKNYIKTHSTLLKDYNYEGSAINNMVNVLAYVTQYNMFYLNSVTKELFISSAQLNNSVHLLANMLNYIPKRNVAPTCQVLLTNNSTVDNQYIYFGTEFITNNINMTYMGEVVTIPPSSSVTISVKQGELVTQNWISDGTPFQTYRLQDKEKVDNTYLFVGVDNTSTMAFDWINVNTQNPIVGGKYYYIDYLDDMFIKFDNGVLYQMPRAEQIVGVRYLRTEGNFYANTVLIGSGVTTENVNISGVCVTNFSDGENAETLDEIKSRAILNYTTQNRVVTESDYNIFLEKYPGYSAFQDAYVFGGENVYIDINGLEIEYVPLASWQDVGYVYISALKKSNDIYNYGYLSNEDKVSIESYFTPYKVITIFFKFVDPIIVYFSPKLRIKMKTMVDFDSVEFEEKVDKHIFDTYNGMNLTVSKSNITKYIDSIPGVNYSDIDYDMFVKINKETATHSIVPLNTEIEQIKGCYVNLGNLSEKVEVGYMLKNGINEAKIIDTNIHQQNELALLSLSLYNSSTFSVGNVVDIYDREGILLTSATISNINDLYIESNSGVVDIFVKPSGAPINIGYVNCDTGFIKINNYTGTILDDMNTFGFEFEQKDGISYRAKREIFVCPELSSITYI